MNCCRGSPKGELTPLILRKFFRGETIYQIAGDLVCHYDRVYSILRRRGLKMSTDMMRRGRCFSPKQDHAKWDEMMLIDEEFEDLESR